MKKHIVLVCWLWVATIGSLGPAAVAQTAKPATAPAKVYVPYDQLKLVFEKEKQGVFLPYAEFQRLWQAAQGAPAGVEAAPVPYLISTARFSGKVGAELASMQLELTVDILQDGWVEVPLGLGEVAVAKAEFAPPAAAKVQPLLRVVDGKYVLLTKGAGRRVLKVDFVRQLVTQTGLNVLSFRIPSAAINTLELLIPEENMKVDVEPMLAAGTTQVGDEGKKSTKLQAFLGASDSVRLSWKPKSQAAEDLTPVVLLEQCQHLHVSEALINYDIRFDLDIRRRGLDTFTIQLPADYRVVSVDGANISKWDMNPEVPQAGQPQVMTVRLFSAVKDRYTLTVKMERFLKDPSVQIKLPPAMVQQVLQSTGLIAVTHSSGRSVQLGDLKNLARVDTGRLSEDMRSLPGVTAFRFITADYGATMSIGTVEPRISLNQDLALSVQPDRLELRGRLAYVIERAGVFQASFGLPEPWEIVSLTGADGAAIVDEFQLSSKGKDRVVNVLLKQETTGAFALDLAARMTRPKPDAAVDFSLPAPDVKLLHVYKGQLVIGLADQLRAEVERADQLVPLPVERAANWRDFLGGDVAMAFEFKAIDGAKPAGVRLKIAQKPTQVSAVVHRLVSIQQGALEQEAVIQYNVMYAQIDTFYVKVPAALADAGVQISGADIKEKPRIDSLPPGQAGKDEALSPASKAAAAQKWAYYKVVLQTPVIGPYVLTLNVRQPFQAAKTGQTVTIQVEPILAAGRISDQSGHVAVAKAETLAILSPTFQGLISADPGSASDLPYEPHRRLAALAFKYSAPPFALSLPVLSQAQAAVITTIASAAIVEQVVARDGKSNARAVFLLATSRGDRLPITLPAGAKLFAVLVNGAEAPVEPGASADERIVRLPPSAGQVSKVVLEVAYQLEKASASSLSAPALPKEFPVQQTVWRLWVPSEDYVLGYDRTFSRLGPDEGASALNQLAQGAPGGLAFKMEGQGQVIDFLRQGSPDVLSVTTMGKEAFSILVWVLILGIGAAMLRLGGYRRTWIVLAAALVLMVIYLFSPVLVGRVMLSGFPAMIIVAVVWAAKWLFLRAPGRTQAAPATAAAPTTTAGEKSTDSAQPQGPKE